MIVIGVGPVGYTLADRARAAGLSVAAVERELVGGECSYWACIPSKAIKRKALARAAAAGAIGLAAVGGLAAFAGPARAAGWPGTASAVYTMTNSPGGNVIEAYARAGDGALTPAATYPTGGDGGTLDSGHSIAVSGDGRVVVNVNAGSNSISAFAATPWGLRLIGTASSAGTDPDSVTIAGDNLVYVLNVGSKTTTRPPSRSTRTSARARTTSQNYLYVLAAGLNQIVGYRVGPDGSLTQVTTVPVATGSAGVGAS